MADHTTIIEVFAQLADEPKGLWTVVEQHDDIGYHVTLQHKKTKVLRVVQILATGNVVVSV